MQHPSLMHSRVGAAIVSILFVQVAPLVVGQRGASDTNVVDGASQVAFGVRDLRQWNTTVSALESVQKQPWYHPDVDKDIMDKIKQIRDEILTARDRAKDALKKLKAATRDASANASDLAASAAAQRRLEDAKDELAAAERDSAVAREYVHGQEEAMAKERKALRDFREDLDAQETEIVDVQHLVDEAERTANSSDFPGAEAGAGNSGQGREAAARRGPSRWDWWGSAEQGGASRGMAGDSPWWLVVMSLAVAVTD
uniref:Uncharacterized protein n=1 Tax=Alexandrium andersonii TaxID=327968 RepID=A0A7S2F749_9DINO|mmetsp:Transcript_18842/g.42828  ORF Transcript_18842/g.42828 Transcript_18842/m.42828 type:complete len:256 (+) Transcript_18842:69-836(+)